MQIMTNGTMDLSSRREPLVRESRVRTRPLARHIGAATAVGILGVAVLGGCADNDHEIQSFVHEWEASVSAADYHIQPPDSLEISSAEAPEIDGEVQTVRQDGKITLRLLGEVKVAGMTPVEVARKLESLLSAYYLDPHVNIRVNNTGSKKFYVFGQVARQGPFAYTGRDTLLSALAQAQPTFIAAKEMIKVVRPSHEDDKRHVMTVNAFRMLEEGRLDQNILLQEGDIIYVPPTVLGWIGLRFQEILFPIAPVANAAILPAATANSFDYYDGGNDDD